MMQRPQGPGGQQPQQQDMQMMGGGAGGGGAFEGAQLDVSAGLSEEVLAAKIKEVALAIIGEDADDEGVEMDTPLMEAGLTSSTAVLMSEELKAAIPGVKLPPTAMFDYPSIAAMAEFLLEQLQPK